MALFLSIRTLPCFGKIGPVKSSGKSFAIEKLTVHLLQHATCTWLIPYSVFT